MWNNVVNAWWQLVFYPATDAPRFRKGMWVMIGTGIATLLVTFLVWYLERREHRGRAGVGCVGGQEERERELDEKSAEAFSS